MELSSCDTPQAYPQDSVQIEHGDCDLSKNTAGRNVIYMMAIFLMSWPYGPLGLSNGYHLPLAPPIHLCPQCPPSIINTQSRFSPPQDCFTSFRSTTFVGPCTHKLVVSHIPPHPSPPSAERKTNATPTYLGKKSRLKHPLHQSNRNRIMPTGPHPFSKTRTGTGTLRIALKCRPGGRKPPRHTISATALIGRNETPRSPPKGSQRVQTPAFLMLIATACAAGPRGQYRGKFLPVRAVVCVCRVGEDYSEFLICMDTPRP